MTKRSVENTDDRGGPWGRSSSPRKAERGEQSGGRASEKAGKSKRDGKSGSARSADGRGKPYRSKRSDKASRSNRNEARRGAKPYRSKRSEEGRDDNAGRSNRNEDRRDAKPYRTNRSEEGREGTSYRSDRRDDRRSTKPGSRPGRSEDRRGGKSGCYDRSENRRDGKPGRPERGERRRDGGKRFSHGRGRDGDRRRTPSRTEDGRRFEPRRNDFERDTTERQAEQKVTRPNPLKTERKKGLVEFDNSGVVEIQGERLQKVLAARGLGSRREIEKYIMAGEVRINGEVATLGQRAIGGESIQFGDEHFEIPTTSTDKTEILLYHKPVGEICSREDAKGRTTVFECIPKPTSGRWVMIGRLDINTSGLLLFTNNGALANYMMHPSNEVLRSYKVRVFGNVDSKGVERLRDGIMLDDGMAHFERCEFIAGRSNNKWYNVSLREGRNREVRRMWEAIGGTVSRLIRIAYGPMTLPETLKFGESRWANQAEVDALAKLSGFDLVAAVAGDGTVHKIEPEEH